MMRKVYYLKTCDTSRRIIKDLGNKLAGFQFQDTKEQPLTATQLEEMKELAGSYEALFSRRAKKYHEMALKNLDLTEADYKHYLLNEYTFLKRPVIIIDKDIFIGSSRKDLLKLKEKLSSL